MESTADIKARAIASGIRKKRRNAVTALACAGVPAVILAMFFPMRLTASVVGFVVGFIWGNLFEYVYHRFVLHVPINYLMERHLEHHSTIGTPTEADHLNFGESPWYVVGLFATNTVPVVLMEWRFHWGCAVGILAAFAAYFMSTEEIHWRIHMGAWLPPVVELARKFHMTHHRRPHSRYAVFFPLFDWLLNTTRDSAESAQTRRLAGQ